MTSATLAAYQQGTAPLEAQQETVRAYINSIPLAASAGYGDVEGLGDGLWAWYGADVSKVNPLLLAPEKNLSAAQMVNRAARAYREVLSLLLALQVPGRYLVDDPEILRLKRRQTSSKTRRPTPFGRLCCHCWGLRTLTSSTAWTRGAYHHRSKRA